MIELYRTADCPYSPAIEATLQELVVAHRVIVVGPNDGDSRQSLREVPNTLPALQDNGQLISGAEAIEAHLRQLKAFVEEWRKFQADACYCDEDK